MNYFKSFNVNSLGPYYSINLMPRIEKIIEDSKISDGLMTIFLMHTTGALMLLEHEIGVVQDIIDVIHDLLSNKKEFYHHMREVDDNGLSHVLSALFKTSISIPLKNGKLSVGEYQDLVFMDFQGIPKEREISLHIQGESGC